MSDEKARAIKPRQIGGAPYLLRIQTFLSGIPCCLFATRIEIALELSDFNGN